EQHRAPAHQGRRIHADTIVDGAGQWLAQQGVGFGTSNGAIRPPGAGVAISTRRPSRYCGRTKSRVSIRVSGSHGGPPRTATSSTALSDNSVDTGRMPVSDRTPGKRTARPARPAA